MPTLYEEVSEIMNKGALAKATLSPAAKTQILQILKTLSDRIEEVEGKLEAHSFHNQRIK